MQTRNFKFSNETFHTNTQCKVVIYPWVNELNDPNLSDDQLSKASRLDISSQVTQVNFLKPIGSPAGTFTITLSNSPGYGSQDWKDIIKRGFWCLIYMSQEGDLSMTSNVDQAKNSPGEAKRVRCIGYIDRVAIVGDTIENRASEISYEVTGRDFGVVYEDTTIWHNLFQFEQILLTNVKDTKLNIIGNTKVHTALDLIHDLFFYPANVPGAQLNNDKSLLSIGLQWLMPKEMLLDLGYKSLRSTFWGSLPKSNLLRFSPTSAGLSIAQPLDYLNGNAWEQLKRLSVPQFHEMFTETDANGQPGLVFRPIPWGIDNSNYKNNRPNIILFKDLDPVITVPAVQLKAFNIGEDNNNRYNSFLAMVSSGYINTEDNISFLKGTGFPKQNKASIKRHGFRPMHVEIDSLVKNEELANGKADFHNLVEFNYMLYDYWNLSVFGESGSFTKIGSNDVKNGCVLKFGDDVPYFSTRRYYIEGYSDTFVVDSNRAGLWLQEVSVTHGFEEDDLRNKTGFSKRDVPFKYPGEFTPGSSGTKS